jgi:hypothetical protein
MTATCAWRLASGIGSLKLMSKSNVPNSGDPWWLCVATGPSLRRTDLDALRWIGERSIAANCGVFFAPWVGRHYAADEQWYRYYGWRTRPWYQGERYGAQTHRSDVKRWRHRLRWTEKGGNSGHHIIHMAVELGATRIAIIGYDHQHTGGKTHVHGDHPSRNGMRMGNAQPAHVWARRMPATARDLARRGVQLINLTRVTAIQCFDRMTAPEFTEEYGP